MFPPVTAVEVGPNRAKDSAQPVNKVSPNKKPKIFFILPFIFSQFKQRFICYKTNESLKMSLYIIQPVREVLFYEIIRKGLFSRQLSKFSII